MPYLLLSIIPLFSFTLIGFRGLAKQGILYHDVGMNLLEARFIREGVQILPGVLQDQTNKADFWEMLKKKTNGVPLHSGKPGYSAVLWLAGLIRGFHNSLASEVGVASGIAGLILVFLLALHWTGPREALYSVTVLASSTMYFLFSRSGLSDAVTCAFFLAGLTAYPKPRTDRVKMGRYYLTGLFFGLAFACTQWRAAYILGILFMVDFFRALQERGTWTGYLGRTAATFAGFITPIVFFELPYIALRMIAGPLPFTGYWGQLYDRLLQGQDLNWFQDWTQLSRTYWAAEQGVIPLLAGVGWVALICHWARARKLPDTFFLAFSIIPFVYFSAMTYSGNFLPRTTSLALPATAICVAIMLSRLQGMLESRWTGLSRTSLWASAALVIGLSAQGAIRQVSTAITSSGYAEASDYLATTGDRRFLFLAMEPVWRFHLGRVAFEPYNRPQDLAALVQTAEDHGINRVIVDHETLHSKYGMGYTRKLLEAVPLERNFPNPLAGNVLYLLDTFGLEGAKEIEQDPAAARIYIYHIRDIAKALSRNDSEKSIMEKSS